MRYHSIVILLLLFLAGCGRGHVQLSGTVVFADDGSPVTKGSVIFSTPTFQARGDLDDQGRFTMGSFGQRDGFPPGTYQVGVAGAIVSDPSGARFYDLLAEDWRDPSTSGFELTIDQNTRDLEIRVERNPAPRPW